ncbi:MDR family MFS transporter [Lactococcus nasutitermitis]|uniref:MDR family MFS transporter n=1 Tax=Lactococcus nasutitermitis TaxID=1652957 RepID=A0ABV9JFM7_9LACT|nr:MDR family MFS transporter [Lactococcus nasutitermitis]
MNDKQLNHSLTAFLFSNIMVGLEGTILATALPSMMAQLHGISLMSWVITIYMLMMSVSAPIWTKLSERFGYKRLFLIGTALFTLASALEGLSVNMPMLIIARLIMGIGAGAMQQLPFVIYGILLNTEKRRRATGNAISAYSLSAVIAPIIGGLIVDNLGWRWVFFINIPIGLLMMLAVARNFHPDFQAHKKPIDFAGTSTLSLGVISLMLALQFLGTAKPNLPLILILFILSIILLTSFWQIEKRAKDPIVPLTLFKEKSYMFKNLLMFLIYGFFGFYSNYLPTWGQGILGKTAFIGGLILIPSSIFLVIGSQIATRLAQQIGEKRLTIAGSVLMLLGAIILFLTPQVASFSILLLIAGILGFSTGISSTTLQVGIQESVTSELIGAATALNALIRTLGTTLILSGLSVSLNRTFSTAITKNHKFNFTLINQISDSEAVKHLPHALITPLRHVLFNGLHSLALIGTLILCLALIVNIIDPWTKKSA